MKTRSATVRTTVSLVEKLQREINIGSDKLIQYAHISDKTNVTSRIGSAAEADEIVISQSIFDKLTNQSLPIEKLPRIMVKGKDQPLQLYRLFGSKYPRLLLI